MLGAPPCTEGRGYRGAGRLLRYYRRGLRARNTQEAPNRRAGIERTEHGDLHAVCLFIGYPKSGHSLVGALLDAHPDMIIARATNPLALVVENGFSRARVFEILVESSRHQATRGRKQNRYRYTVEGQWQGRVRTLRVIGDKFSDRTTKRIRRSPGALDTFEREMGLPMRLIHVTRNPFDMVARIAISKIAEGIPRERVARATDYVARLAKINDEVIAAGTPPVFTVRHESLIDRPQQELRRICEFLGVEADDRYLDACAGIVFPSPQRTRDHIDWSRDDVAAVEHVIARHHFFRGYAFAEPD